MAKSPGEKGSNDRGTVEENVKECLRSAVNRYCCHCQAATAWQGVREGDRREPT